MAISGAPPVAEALLNAPHWQMLLPDVRIAHIDTTSTTPDISIEGVSGSSFQYEPMSEQITTDIGHISSTIATISYIFERHRQEQNQYTVHGNLVSKNGQAAIAFIGGISGIGKSTLSAFVQQQGWKWLSDDKFVVDAQSLSIGVMSQSLADEKTLKAIGTQKTDERHDNLPIFHFIIPIVTDEENLTVHYYDREKALWHIYEELSREIRISNGLLDAFGPLPSFDTQLAAKNRVETARFYAENIPMIYLRGNREKIFAFLQAL